MKMLHWELLHPRADFEMLGFLPSFVFEDDPRHAAEQFNERYVFGGWSPFRGFEFDPKDGSISYPGDPVMKPLAKAQLRDETIYFYQSAWVGIHGPLGFEISRMD